MTTYNYDETFESRIQEIRLDGPSIYTSILEKTDNSVGWGECDTIKLDFDKSRMILGLSDNSPMGFKSVEAIHRFFTLGKKNDSISSKTIGKFGRGGYKATMNIGNSFSLTSIIDGKSYTLSTDFIDMIRNNTQTPTGELIIEDNKKGLVGSHFKINIRPEYHNSFDTKTFKKHFVRAFHQLPRKIKIIIDKEECIPADINIFNDYMQKKEYIVLWDKDTNKFYAKLYSEEFDSDDNEGETNVNYYKIGILTIFTLTKVVTKNEYLGEHPGIDFYRNDRLCNTHNPLRNIGMIGEHLKCGQLRGGRCHMTFKYENIQLTDNLDVDDCIGLTTNKEIPEDTSKFNESLLNIFEEKAKECSKMYEGLWQERKNNISQEITNVYNQLNTIIEYKDEDLYLNTLDVKEILDNYNNFKECKHWKINEDGEGLTYYFYKTKKEVKKAKENSEDIIQQRANWPLFKTVECILDLSKEILKRKKSYSDYIDLINAKKTKLEIEFKSAQLIVDLETLISKKLKEIPKKIDDININHSSEDYEKTINILTDIIKYINRSKVKKYFKSRLNEYKQNITHYKSLKEDKFKEEEKERIALEETMRLKEEKEKKDAAEKAEEKKKKDAADKAAEKRKKDAAEKAEEKKLQTEQVKKDSDKETPNRDEGFVDAVGYQEYEKCKHEIKLIKDKYPIIFTNILKEFLD